MSVTGLRTGSILLWFWQESVTSLLLFGNSCWKKKTWVTSNAGGRENILKITHRKEEARFHRDQNSSRHGNISCSSKAAIIRDRNSKKWPSEALFRRFPLHCFMIKIICLFPHVFPLLFPLYLTKFFSVLSFHISGKVIVNYHSSCWGKIFGPSNLICSWWAQRLAPLGLGTLIRQLRPAWQESHNKGHNHLSVRKHLGLLPQQTLTLRV